MWSLIFFLCIGFSTAKSQLLDQCKKKLYSEFCFYSFPDKFLDCLFNVEKGCFMNLCVNVESCYPKKINTVTSKSTEKNDQLTTAKNDRLTTAKGLDWLTTSSLGLGTLKNIDTTTEASVALGTFKNIDTNTEASVGLVTLKNIKTTTEDLVGSVTFKNNKTTTEDLVGSVTFKNIKTTTEDLVGMVNTIAEDSVGLVDSKNIDNTLEDSVWMINTTTEGSVGMVKTIGEVSVGLVKSTTEGSIGLVKSTTEGSIGLVKSTTEGSVGLVTLKNTETITEDSTGFIKNVRNSYTSIKTTLSTTKIPFKLIKYTPKVLVNGLTTSMDSLVEFSTANPSSSSITPSASKVTVKVDHYEISKIEEKFSSNVSNTSLQKDTKPLLWMNTTLGTQNIKNSTKLYICINVKTNKTVFSQLKCPKIAIVKKSAFRKRSEIDTPATTSVSTSTATVKNAITTTVNPHHIYKSDEEFWLEKVHHKKKKKKVKHTLNEVRSIATLIFGFNFN